MTVASFEVISVAGCPEMVPGTSALLVDQYDWLQLTIGRFLAPARATAQGVDYLLLGEQLPEGSDELAEAIEAELQAFEAALQNLDDCLTELIDSDVGREHVLASLATLLQLGIPSAHGGQAFIRGGALQLVGWGMTGSSAASTVALKRLIGGRAQQARRSFLATLRDQLQVAGKVKVKPLRSQSLGSDAPADLVQAGMGLQQSRVGRAPRPGTPGTEHEENGALRRLRVVAGKFVKRVVLPLVLVIAVLVMGFIVGRNNARPTSFVLEDKSLWAVSAPGMGLEQEHLHAFLMKKILHDQGEGRDGEYFLAVREGNIEAADEKALLEKLVLGWPVTEDKAAQQLQVIHAQEPWSGK